MFGNGFPDAGRTGGADAPMKGPAGWTCPIMSAMIVFATWLVSDGLSCGDDDAEAN
jgi:hypothetical protein